jgi:lysozyme family protein
MIGGLEKCMPIELRYEGGFANRPKSEDRGGVTLEGVTQRVYDGFRSRKGKPRQPLMAAMRNTPEWIAERDEIYRFQFWNAVRGDELPAGIDLFMFDSGILSGPYQATLWLQRGLAAAGCYHDVIDGHLGEGTLAALQNHPDHKSLLADMASRRLGMMQELSTWSANKNGWTARVANVKAIGQSWAAQTIEDSVRAPAPEPIDAQPEGHDKAYASDVAQPAVDAGDAVKAGVGSGAVTGVLEGARDQIAPLAYASDTMMKIYTGLTVLCVLLGLAAIGYSIWANRKTKNARRAIDGNAMADVPDTYAPQAA